jgi:hypothetical protein
MSHPVPDPTPRPPVVPTIDNRATGDSTHCNQDNAGNATLPDNDGIVFQIRVEALAALIRDGQITNKARAIERVFGCSRSSKTESVYQQVHRALEPLIQTGPQFRPLTPEQQAAREQLELPRH